VRRKPYSVVLFDEIEKAHPEFFNILLQVLEDGYLTDAKGKKVDFTNTIIIMTSNIGAKKLTQEASKIGFALTVDTLKQAEVDFNEKKDQVLSELKDTFRPEFLNRVDKVIVFQPLTNESIQSIVKLQIEELNTRLQEKGISISVTNEAAELLAKLSYTPEYGARPVRRKIQDMVEDPVAEKILNGEFKSGDSIKISRIPDKEELTFVKVELKVKNQDKKMVSSKS